MCNHVLVLLVKGSRPSHLEILLDLHQLLQDSPVGRVLLTDPLLQAVHSPP